MEVPHVSGDALQRWYLVNVHLVTDLLSVAIPVGLISHTGRIVWTTSAIVGISVLIEIAIIYLRHIRGKQKNE